MLAPLNYFRLMAGVLISSGGLVLLWSICAAVQYNVWWMSSPVLLEFRLGLYLWSAVAMAVTFVLRGVVTASLVTMRTSFVLADAALELSVAGTLIVVACGWRIRTDVAPPQGVHELRELPVSIRLLADPWISGVTILSLSVAVAVILGIIHRRDIARAD
jgi:hypothetical protein